MQFKKRIPLFLFLGTFPVWIVSIVLLLLPISPWGEHLFPKSLDPNAIGLFVTMTAISASEALVIGLRGIFQKPTVKENTNNLGSLSENSPEA